MRLSNRPRPPGFALADTLAVIAIIVILLALASSFLLGTREKAERARCLNNLRQLGVATHKHQDAHGSMPPGYGTVGNWPAQGSAQGTVFFHLLPFLGEEGLFETCHVKNDIGDCYRWGTGGSAGVGRNPLRQLQCPADPSMPPTGVVQGWGAMSYAFNAQVFSCVGSDNALGRGPDWQPIDTWSKGWNSEAYPKVPDSFGDHAAARTIVFAERYAQCGGDPVQAGYYANLWCYPTNGHDYSPYFAARVGYVYDPEAGTVPDGLVRTVRFQVQPGLYATTVCNPHRASTGHSMGMSVCMADGSTRALSRNMAASSFWAATTLFYVGIGIDW